MGKLKILLACLIALAACGGGTGGGGGGGSATNIYTGTITVTSAKPASPPPCDPAAPSATVTFLPAGAGVDVHTRSVPGGGCVNFVNNDANPHKVATRPTNPCVELNAANAITNGQTFTAGPLGAAGPVACDWEDTLNPPGSGGY